MNEEIHELFKLNLPTDETISKTFTTRLLFSKLLNRLNEMGLESREYSLAVTKLQESFMWTQAAINQNKRKEEF